MGRESVLSVNENAPFNVSKTTMSSTVDHPAEIIASLDIKTSHGRVSVRDRESVQTHFFLII
jgi:hypothetical protein